MTKNQKKIAGLIALIVIACISVGFAIFQLRGNEIYGGNGIYYAQQGNGKYIQFKSDKTFSYAYDPEHDLANKADKDNLQAEILGTGTWKEKDNKINIVYDDGGAFTFVKSGEYFYREDTVFAGKPTDEKLLNNRFVIKEDDKVVEEIWFLDDGTVEHIVSGNSKIRRGTYTRTDDILTVRFDDLDYGMRYLVIENGITKDIYAKNPVKN